eukprot:scaffold58012_cov20-Tisochrysis_lutea.AAC.1
MPATKEHKHWEARRVSDANPHCLPITTSPPCMWPPSHHHPAHVAHPCHPHISSLHMATIPPQHPAGGHHRLIIGHVTYPAGETPLDSNFIDFFLKGNLSLEKARRLKPYDWLPDQGWQDLTRLVQLGSSKLNASGACAACPQAGRWTGKVLCCCPSSYGSLLLYGSACMHRTGRGEGGACWKGTSKDGAQWGSLRGAWCPVIISVMQAACRQGALRACKQGASKVHPLARLADDIEADEAIWREFYEQ